MENSYPAKSTGIFFTMNNTTDISKDVKISSHLPVYGYPGTNFYVVHISALISLGTSIIVSSGVLLYLLTTTTIWNRPIGKVTYKN